MIGGGLVGCEMALDYAQDGKEVMVVEALPKILSAGILSPIPNGQMIPDLFEHHHVTVLEKHRLSAVENGKVILESDGQKKVLDAALSFMRLATDRRSAQSFMPYGMAMR